MNQRQILATINPEYEPEGDSPLDDVVSALEQSGIPAHLMEVNDTSNSKGDALRDALSRCIEEMEQCRRMFSDDKGFIAALESAEAALSNDSEPKQVEIFQGYFGFEGAALNVEFQAFVGASVAEKDAAFMATLAQQADVDYHSIGVAECSQDVNESTFDGPAEIASVMMQEVVGDYDTPDTVPEWAWVEHSASYTHARNGEDGVWEFVLNLSMSWDDIPEKLQPVIAEARSKNVAYLIFHQGT